jgi:hypothetical protein
LSVTWDVGKTISTISIYKDFLFLPPKLFCDEGLIWEFLVCTKEFSQGHWYHFKWTSIRKKEDLRETGVVPNHNVASSICFETSISNVGLFICLFRKLYILNIRIYFEKNNMIVMNKGLEVSLSWPVSRQIIPIANKSWIGKIIFYRATDLRPYFKRFMSWTSKRKLKCLSSTSDTDLSTVYYN